MKNVARTRVHEMASIDTPWGAHRVPVRICFGAKNIMIKRKYDIFYDTFNLY